MVLTASFGKWKKIFEEFFNNLHGIEPTSLALTREVLKERKNSKLKVISFQDKVNCGINVLNQQQQKEKASGDPTADIDVQKKINHDENTEVEKNMTSEEAV